MPCGGTFYATDDVQTITTPNNPGNYPVNQRCAWIIDANATSHVRLEVTEMDIEAENDCNNDYVEFRDMPEVNPIKGCLSLPDVLCSMSLYALCVCFCG